MSIEENKRQFSDTGSKVKKAVQSNDLFKAMDLAMTALKGAVDDNNEQLKDSYLSLVRAVHVFLENQDGSIGKRKARNCDA